MFTGFLALLWAAFLQVPPPQAGGLPSARPRQPIDVTYLDNCGFLVQVGDKKVLFDPRRAATAEPPATRDALRTAFEAMNEGRAPFDGLETVIVTHPHTDHLDAAAMAAFLAARPAARLYSTVETREAIRAAAPSNFDAIGPRIVVVTPGEGGVGRFEANGIRLTVLALLHAGAPRLQLTSLSVVAQFDGARVFFLSDIDPGYEPNRRVIERWAAGGEPIDLLLSPDVDLRPNEWSPRGYEIVAQVIRPARVVATHVSAADADRVEQEVRVHYPGAVVFRSVMERRKFE